MGLDTVELEFELEIPDAAAEKMIPVGDMQAFLVGELRGLGRGRDPVQVFEGMRAIIVRQLGVSPEAVVPNARFVKDLHAD